MSDAKKSGPGRGIGITMALLGVMLAFCAAMVGSSRTELIATTIAQANRWGAYQTEATKYRAMEADVEMLHAVTPNQKEVTKFETRLDAVKKNSGKGDSEDSAELKEALKIASTELADVLTPDKEDEDRLSKLAGKYKHDTAEAKEDAEAYDMAIEAHHEASEWFERAQLCAEVGIVIASIALMLGSRRIWMISMAAGVAAVTIVAYTLIHTRSELHQAEKKIEDAKTHTAELQDT